MKGLPTGKKMPWILRENCGEKTRTENYLNARHQTRHAGKDDCHPWPAGKTASNLPIHSSGLGPPTAPSPPDTCRTRRHVHVADAASAVTPRGPIREIENLETQQGARMQGAGGYSRIVTSSREASRIKLAIFSASFQS